MFVIADVCFRDDALLRYVTRWQFRIDANLAERQMPSDQRAMEIRYLAEKFVAKALELSHPEMTGLSVASESETEDFSYNTVSKSGFRFQSCR